MNSEKAKITRCAIYTRVSTDMQAEVEFNSCEAQEDRIRAFIASQEGFEVFKVYSDPGYSGANMNRPALRQLINDVRSGQVKMVMTYKIDRLTRSPRDFYELIEFLEGHQASFISVTERFDTSTPSGRLLRNIMLTFAQFERELASERVKDKVAQRVNRGLYHGGHPPYGYKAENGALVLDPPRDAVVKRIFEIYAETRSQAAVMKFLKKENIQSRRGKPFCESAIWYTLQKEVYTGKIVYKGKVYPGQHPPIISDELFRHVQALIKEGPRFHVETHSHLPFAGIVRCGECGSTMCVTFTNKEGKSGRKRYYYYRCTKVNNDGAATCSTRQIGAERLHESVYSNLLRISMDTDYLKNLVFALQNRFTHPRVKKVEPPQDIYNLTPEKLQKNLNAFIKACARKTGIEKVLLVRRCIGSVRYSKKSIGVDFAIDGDSPSAGGGSESEAGRGCAAPKKKESNRLNQLDSDFEFETRKNGGGSEI